MIDFHLETRSYCSSALSSLSYSAILHCDPVNITSRFCTNESRGEGHMLNDQLATFTDRHEAIALFNFLRGRDPVKPWPLLPILAFVAPGGSGKSLLLRYLREKECSVGGSAAIPYDYLDFTLPHTPKELLPILMELRDQLQQQDDGQGNHLVFPRFDLVQDQETTCVRRGK